MFTLKNNMKMKVKKLIIIIVALIFSVSLYAQPHERQDHYEEQGEKLIGKASDKIKSYSSLIIDFSYISKNTSQDIFDESEGMIYLEGDKYNIAFDEYEYISNGETVWACLKDVKEIHISYAENIEQSMNPVHLLDDFQKHYRAKLIRQETILGELVNLVDVVPNKPHSFYKYRVAIKDSDHMLSFIEAYDRHGGTYKIHINNIETDTPIPDEKFKFDEDAYSDMDIIDLR